ncbi:hypothetical protein F4802DRAFT_393054 [Xylaria palmicola]|nr:hypothetical protein F4802DRAFT_393054 [Xylaria palmicola]
MAGHWIGQWRLRQIIFYWLLTGPWYVMIWTSSFAPAPSPAGIIGVDVEPSVPKATPFLHIRPKMQRWASGNPQPRHVFSHPRCSGTRLAGVDLPVYLRVAFRDHIVARGIIPWEEFKERASSHSIRIHERLRDGEQGANKSCYQLTDPQMKISGDDISPEQLVDERMGEVCNTAT